MHPYPTLPRLDDAPSGLLDGGHLWVLEYVDGAPLRFQLTESGVVRFGDARRTFDPDAVPLPYRHAVRHVRACLDRAALRSAVDAVEDVVLFGVATQRRTVDYDFGRTPPVLGTHVWDGDRFLPPDAAASVFDRLGLDAVPALDKEVRAAGFDRRDYDDAGSRLRDGPVAGVVVRDKTGHRAKWVRESVRQSDPPTEDPTPADLVRTVLTDDLLDRLVASLDDGGEPTVDALYDRALERVGRERADVLSDASADEVGTVRSEVAAVVRSYLDAS